MHFTGDQYGRRTLDFVEKLHSLVEYDDVCRAVMDELSWYGFTCITSVDLPGPGESFKDGIVINSRPQEYIDRYAEKNYVVRDPVVTELRHTLHPYSWGDVRQRRDLNKADQRIIDEAVEFDVTDGFIVPIVTLSGATSIFCPCGPEPDLTQRSRTALEIIGIFSHQALSRALINCQRSEVAHTPLTPREREIMQWVAAGKSDDEIADILSIGASTVTSHVENAKGKLDAFKRTYAVVQALRFGEISL